MPRLGSPSPHHRERLREVLDATELFRPDEIAVALELFDLGIAASGGDYRWLAAFEPDDHMIGAACWGPTPATDRSFDLYWIAVDPDAQGCGVGSALLDAVEAGVREDDGRLLVVETSGRPVYAATRGFYLRRGYHEAARIDDFYAPGDARVILVKRLRDAGAHATIAEHAEQHA